MKINCLDKINILGINLTKSSRQAALKKIDGFLTDGGQHQIVTPNPEIILHAIDHDEELFYILNKADLAMPDGVALKFAAWLMGENITRVAGADLVRDILAMAEARNRPVVVFNWRDGLSSQADIRQALANKYPGLPALILDIGRSAVILEEKLALAKEFQPEIIFSTLGAPYQEKFIFHVLPQLLTVKLGLGVGGSFDFLTGRIKRAPKIFRIIGLEWLWRLYKQPKRWKRIYNAVIVFPYKFFLWRFQ